MGRRSLGVAVLAVIVTAGVHSPTRAAETKPQPNAALTYWQGFALMPTLSDTEDRLVAQYKTAPLDEHVKGVVERSGTALTCLHRGAAVARCDWGLNIEDGPGVLLPHLAKGRQLARLACLRARWRFHTKHHRAALDDLAATLTLARHLGRDGMIIGLLVRILVERMAIEVAADHLPGQAPEALRAFRARLAALPPSPTVKEALLEEKEVMLGWFRRQFQRLERKDAADVLKALVGSDREASAILKAIRGTKEGLTRFLDQSAALYDEVAELQDLPMDRLGPAMKAFEQKVERTNPLVRQFLPALHRIRYWEAEAQTRLAMLMAAIDVVLDGKDALTKHTDPFGDGPFQYKPLENGGFELRSKLAVPKEGPLTLTVGAPSKPAGTK